MKSCRLCFEDSKQDTFAKWNEPLFESPNFIVLPSLGALVEGWLLIAPKKHFICMGALPDSLIEEMNGIKRILCSALQGYYGQVCAFEHGPSRPSCEVGCGVDHAHLHVVPVSFDLATAAGAFLPEDAIWAKANLDSCRSAFGRGENYLYLEQPIGEGRIIIHQQLGSQLFRRAIAKQVGVLDKFNWREYPQFLNVSSTIEKFHSKIGTLLSCKGQPEAAA
jgi:ATP adenylyltransferase